MEQPSGDRPGLYAMRDSCHICTMDDSEIRWDRVGYPTPPHLHKEEFWQVLFTEGEGVWVGPKAGCWGILLQSNLVKVLGVCVSEEPLRPWKIAVTVVAVV